MLLKPRTTVNTTTEFKLELTSSDIIRMLKETNPDLGVDIHATVAVKVPSGGDYSGCSLDIGHDNPLLVRWTTYKVSTEAPQ